MEKEEEQLRQELESLQQEIGQFTNTASEEAQHHEKSAVATLGIIFGVSLLIGVILSAVITGNTNRRLLQVKKGLNAVAEGDLRGEIAGRDGRDEIADLKDAPCRETPQER